MRKLIPFLLILSFWWSCSTLDEDLSFDPALELLFSTDTVSFDTLLSDSRSATQRLTIYNPNGSAVQLSEVFLGLGDASDYSIIVNGKPGANQPNERILGGDSLLILVEVDVSPRNLNLPYLVKDSIVINWNGRSEHVKLVSWAQDGTRVGGQVICNQTWTSGRPYIVSDSVIVQEGCQLTIQAGTTIYFENDAALFIQGALNAIGDSANHIVFRNARFDGIYDEVPGQWNGVYFLEGSAGSQIAYAEIFNGQVGLRLGSPDDDDTPDVIIRNSVIYNMSVAGILAFTSDLQATNCLIYNCGSYLVGNFAGGNYTYQHCTFSSDPSIFIHDEPTVQFSDNLVLSDNSLLVDDLNVEVVNSIIWGSGEEELLINSSGEANVIVGLGTNIIRSVEEIQGNFTSTDFNFPGFKDPFTNDFSLDTLAFAKDKGTDVGVTDDLIGASRDDQPDIGAFERKEN